MSCIVSLTPHPQKLCQVAKLQGFKVKFDQCLFGLKCANGKLIKKSTVLMTNSPVLRDQFQDMFCIGDQRVQGHQLGQQVSTAAQHYPPQMAQAIALSVINQWQADNPK